MPAPIASWNPERDCWESSEMDLFSGLSAVYSETFPVSGWMRGGTVYERPTSVPLMDGSASSSSPGLPTPRATRGGSHTETVGMLVPTPLNSDAGPRGGTTGFGLRDWSRELLLGTPRCADGMAHDLRDDVENARGRLEDQISQLLPTPRATDGTKGGPNQRGSSGDLMLPSAVMLLPTPTATPYGSNQSASSGAAVRPSLDTLAPTLLPTPKAGTNLASRKAMTQRHWSAPSLEQALEIARGELPRELEDWSEIPGWSGALTNPPSDDGRFSSAAPRQPQPS